MANTNYVSGIFKILENPEQRLVNETIPVTEFRAQLSQIRKNNIIKNHIINLAFWGNLGEDVISYYKLNDYVIIEGYLSIQNKKRFKITVFKIYPLLLSSENFINDR